MRNHHSAGVAWVRARTASRYHVSDSLFLFVAALVAGWPHSASATCGAAVCALNTAWEAQGVTTEPGLRLDLRFEYIDQDQPRAGRRKVAVGEIPQHHDEIRTINRNWIATFDYAPNPDWGVSLQVPLLNRDHAHIHHQGTPHFESARFGEIGDARLLARRQLAGGEVTHGVIGGLKLPTGKTDVELDQGGEAERSLQPGTGTTDLIVGYYANTLRILGDAPARLFAQAQIQAALDEARGYRPGTQYNLDLGIVYPAAGTWSGLLQVNAQVRGRERGENAEPENSGGSFVWLSPGVSYALGRSTQLYAFVQLPVYQRVNGVQLTADYAAAAGVHWRF